MAANAEGNNIALKFHAENGVTSMLATVMTETHEQMADALTSKNRFDQHCPAKRIAKLHRQEGDHRDQGIA